MFASQNNTAKEALVVVDYQNDFVDGTLGFAGAEKLEDGICAEIERVRKEGGDVLFTFDTHAASEKEYLQSPEGKALPVPHCLSGSVGHALYGKVAECVQPNDVRIFKPSFGSPALAEILQKRGYAKITFVGLVSHICVISNAMLAKAFCPDAEICVLSSLTAAADASLHEAALAVMRSVQIEVL
ncbi:MAG: cysteine hydrolase family protein [Eubacteriales bacterium]|jgi:nicotinamidase/pyrazinamidase